MSMYKTLIGYGIFSFHRLILTFILSTITGFFIGLDFNNKNYNLLSEEEKIPTSRNPIMPFVKVFSKLNEYPRVYYNSLDVYNSKESKNENVAREYAMRVKVLCLVMGHQIKDIEDYKDLWGKRCNMLLIWDISLISNQTLEFVKKKKRRIGRRLYWRHLIIACIYLYRKHIEEAEWFLIANKFTYVILENLRFLLSHYDYNKPLYFNGDVQPSLAIMSREGLAQFAELGISDVSCRKLARSMNPFLKLAMCLNSTGATLLKTEQDNINNFFLSDELQNIMNVTNRIKVTAEDWKNCIDHVINVENNYKEKDMISETALEPFIIQVRDGDSSSDVTYGSFSRIEFLESDFDYEIK